MSNDAEAEADIIRTLQGGPLFEGMFDRGEEVAAVRRMLERGTIRRSYQGAAGLLGLAKLEITP